MRQGVSWTTGFPRRLRSNKACEQAGIGERRTIYNRPRSPTEAADTKCLVKSADDDTMARRSLGTAQLFRDRADAGRALGSLLSQYRGHSNVLVLGLPRGGIPVAYEVALAIDAELDALIVRKISVEAYPELAIGAVADGGGLYVNERLVRELGISETLLDSRVVNARDELREYQQAYRGNHRAPAINGRVVIVVDDGIATGASMKVALQSVRTSNPAELVCAVPVAPTDFAERLNGFADRFFCVLPVSEFRAVGQFYENFDQVPRDEVRRLLVNAREMQSRRA